MKRFLVGLGFALQIAYPALAYFALRYLPRRMALLCLLAALAPSILPRLLSFNRAAMRSLAAVPLLSGTLILLALLLDAQGLALLVPVAINLGFLALFGTTLRGETPMIERFALLSEPNLSPMERQWCRLWTWIWCGFFAWNCLLVSLLSWHASSAPATAESSALTWWTTYTGLLSYVLMGCLLGTEYTLRKYRFGKLKDNLLDRALTRLFHSLGKHQ